MVHFWLPSSSNNSRLAANCLSFFLSKQGINLTHLAVVSLPESTVRCELIYVCLWVCISNLSPLNNAKMRENAAVFNVPYFQSNLKHPVWWKKPVVYGLMAELPPICCEVVRDKWVPTLQENGLRAGIPSMSDEIARLGAWKIRFPWSPKFFLWWNHPDLLMKRPFFWYLLLLKLKSSTVPLPKNPPSIVLPAAKPRKSFSELPGGGGPTTRSVGAP